MKVHEQINAIEQAEEQLEEQKRQLLRKAGWKYSSSYLDSCWRWSKVIGKERLTTADVHEALRIEYILCEPPAGGSRE